jgi:SAM-dependent methyltransferase
MQNGLLSKPLIAQEYAAELAGFNETMRGEGIGDIDRYYWYHAVDLPLASTPGMYDFRESVNCFGFPESMAGKSVLDIGSATGFFAFEFERRGAEVVSVELPSLEQLDRFPGQETSSLLRKLQHMIVPHSADVLEPLTREYSAQELHYYLLDAPFRLCARLLGSGVKRHFSSVYDLSAERLGHAGFDFVFLGDILVHTLRPIDALMTAARLCSGTIMIAQMMPGEPSDPPAMAYMGGSDPAADDICWWLPNENCFHELLSKLGFARVQTIGTHEGILRPAGHHFSRRIIRADRARGLA